MNEIQEIIRDARILRDETTSFNTKAAMLNLLEALEDENEMTYEQIKSAKATVARYRAEEEAE